MSVRTKEEFSQCFEKNLAEYIAKSGKTQAVIASETGITAANISHYSKGIKMPNLYNAYRISKVLNCGVEDLIKE